MERGNNGSNKGHAKPTFQAFETEMGTDELSLLGTRTNQQASRNRSGLLAQLVDISLSAYILNWVVPLRNIREFNNSGYTLAGMTIFVMIMSFMAFVRTGSRAINNTWVASRSIFYMTGLAMSVAFLRHAYNDNQTSSTPESLSFMDFLPLVFFLLSGAFSIVIYL